MQMDTLLQDDDAMALCANADSLGKAITAGLAAGGAKEVQVVLEGITEELRRAMSLTGAKEIRYFDSTVLWRDQD